MKILVVEDNFLIALGLQRLLEGWEHEVTIAHTPDEAIAFSMAKRPDLVLMDIDLGADRDGIETIEQAQEVLGPIPHAYLTGFARRETQREARRTGPAAYIEKPVWPEHLRALIDSLG